MKRGRQVCWRCRHVFWGDRALFRPIVVCDKCWKEGYYEARGAAIVGRAISDSITLRGFNKAGEGVEEMTLDNNLNRKREARLAQAVALLQKQLDGPDGNCTTSELVTLMTASTERKQSVRQWILTHAGVLARMTHSRFIPNTTRYGKGWGGGRKPGYWRKG